MEATLLVPVTSVERKLDGPASSLTNGVAWAEISGEASSTPIEGIGLVVLGRDSSGMDSLATLGISLVCEEFLGSVGRSRRLGSKGSRFCLVPSSLLVDLKKRLGLLGAPTEEVPPIGGACGLPLSRLSFDIGRLPSGLESKDTARAAELLKY